MSRESESNERTIDECIEEYERAVKKYAFGWWRGADASNVKDDRVRFDDEGGKAVNEPLSFEERDQPLQQGLWDGLRVHRELRDALIHRRQDLRDDPTLWDVMLGDAPEEVKELARHVLAEIDRLGLAEAGRAERFAARPTSPQPA